MTKMQVKKAMAAAGIEALELSGAGERWEVTLQDDKTMRKFCKKVCNVGGFGTGWGGWVLRPGYESMGDWNDKSSRHHY